MLLTVSPDQGLWAGGRFAFTIKVPDMYPHEPPKVMCTTPIYHPNIDTAGHVCLNILRDDWKPVLDINARTRSRKVMASRERLVDQLVADSQVDVLKALAAGTLAIELVEAYAREHGMAGAGLAAQVRLSAPLWGALYETLPQMGGSEPTRRRYEVSRDALRAKLPATLTVRDLLTVDWVALKAGWGKSASDWMHARRMLSRFLTLYLGGKHHPVRHQILDRIPYAAEDERTSELTPAQFHQLAKAARADMVAPLWVLVLTGMRMGEYLRCGVEHLRPTMHAIQVPGTKTSASRSLVRVDPSQWHWIEAGIPAPLAYKQFRLLFKAALESAGLPLTTRLHDLRHAHGQWAIDGGASEALVQVSLRHTQASTTRRYTKQKGRADVATALSKTLKNKRGA
jgi:integrase